MKPPPTPATICRKCILRGDVWLGTFCDKVLFGDIADVIAGLDRSGVAVVISNKVVCKFSKHLLNTVLMTHSESTAAKFVSQKKSPVLSCHLY